MSIYGALFSGVSGLTANAAALGIISDNIANISTIGYKGNNASFSSLVTVAEKGTNYNPGGVRVKALQTITQQGLIQGTNSTSDIALSGDGFFVVKDTNDDNDLRTPLYTRAGNFSEDSRGYLRNASGFYLYGWRLDEDGNIPPANADISSTEPVNVAFLNGVATGTTRIELGLNLDSEQTLGATSEDFADPNDAAEMTAKLGGIAPFSHDFNITMTAADGTVTVYNVPVTDTDTLNTLTANIDALVGVRATIVNNQLVINPESVNDKIMIANGTTGTVVTSLFNASSITQLGYDFQRTVRIFDSLGAPRDVVFSFKKQTVNQWSVEVRAGDPTYTQPIDRTTGLVDLVNGDDGYIASGTLTFNTDGSMQSVLGQISGPITLPWDPSVTGAGNQTVNFDFGIDSAGNPTEGAVTQFSSDYNVSFVNQNGAELGQRTGISIDEDGFVIASFSNGEFRKLYKLPIATFANPNGLLAKSGNVFQQTTDSGEYNLREAGSGGAGVVQGASLEQSNIDLGNEFTKMIVTQRAYSAGTKVISTSDDMLQELMQLR